VKSVELVTSNIDVFIMSLYVGLCRDHVFSFLSFFLLVDPPPLPFAKLDSQRRAMEYGIYDKEMADADRHLHVFSLSLFSLSLSSLLSLSLFSLSLFSTLSLFSLSFSCLSLYVTFTDEDVL